MSALTALQAKGPKMKTIGQVVLSFTISHCLTEVDTSHTTEKTYTLKTATNQLFILCLLQLLPLRRIRNIISFNGVLA